MKFGTYVILWGGYVRGLILGEKFVLVGWGLKLGAVYSGVYIRDFTV